MKLLLNFTCTLLLFLMTIAAVAQENITVQTIELDSDLRVGVFEFPNNPNETYRKILMKYQVRCHDAAVGTGNVGCREWDYHCNTVITDSSRVDSLQRTHPSHLVSNFSGTNFAYSNSPTFNEIQFVQHETMLEGNITNHEVGTGTAPSNISLGTSQPVRKTHHLIKGSDLVAAGLTAGNLDGLSLDITEVGTTLDFLKVRIRETNREFLDPEDLLLTGFTEVYFKNTPVENLGILSLPFYNAFTWNGTNNIIVEISYNNDTAGNDHVIPGTMQDYDASVSSAIADGNLNFSGTGYIRVPDAALDAISDGFTFSCWVYGDPDVLPANTTLFEALDADGQRQINVHLPWSDSRVYWDCGNDGSGYDRIDKAVNATNFEGKWNHWAFSKNINTGVMAIYLNGTVFHNGGFNIKPIGELATMRIGQSATGSNLYHGKVDEVRIWNKALDEATIADWMFKPVDDTHPDYNSLIAYYPLDEGDGNLAVDASSFGNDGALMDSPVREMLRPAHFYKNFEVSTVLPNVTFMQGAENIIDNEIVVSDQLETSPHVIRTYDIVDGELSLVNTTTVWPSGDLSIFDEAGSEIGSNYVAPDAIIDIGTLYYYDRFPARYEILSFITPYGNGLDLGQEGKVWTFDVTDFAPILKGSKQLSIEGVGKNSEEYDIKFIFIPGTPPRDVKDIQQLWPIRPAAGIWYGFGMQAIMDDVSFEPRQVSLSAEGSAFKLRSAITGHGQNGEFVPRTHYLNLDGGANEFEYEVWKECAENPIYPQGGTWIFDRSGWCPSMETDVHEFEITDHVTPGGSVEIDYGITGNVMLDADYRVANQLVTYGEPNFSLDASLEDIKRPSTKVEHARMNPVCDDPVVTIRNTGATPLTSLKIEYRMIGGYTLSYDWTGNLAFLESEDVILPVDDYTFFIVPEESFEFEVKIMEPNGGVDEYADNNEILTPMVFPPGEDYEGTLAVRIFTNNRASENSYTIKDQFGNIVLERNGFSNATSYIDDIELSDGCYRIELADTGDDGLDFWYWAAIGQNVGSGSFALLKNNIPIKSFEPDFGDNIFFDFYVGSPVGTEETAALKSFFSVYPNPASGKVFVDLVGFEYKPMAVQVVDLTGRIVTEKTFVASGESNRQLELDVNALPGGMYYIRVNDGEVMRTRSLVVNR